jgi:hypothetical protein
VLQFSRCEIVLKLIYAEIKFNPEILNDKRSLVSREICECNGNSVEL